MDAYLLDWVNLLLRWAHVIVVIAWIVALVIGTLNAWLLIQTVRIWVG